MIAVARRPPTPAEDRILQGVRLRSTVEAIYRLGGAEAVFQALERARIDFVAMHAEEPGLEGWLGLEGWIA